MRNNKRPIRTEYFAKTASTHPLFVAHSTCSGKAIRAAQGRVMKDAYSKAMVYDAAGRLVSIIQWSGVAKGQVLTTTLHARPRWEP